LYYYRARYYDPKAGRFISEDPIGFGGGDVNLFRYVGNNPGNWVDPEGLQTSETSQPGIPIMLPFSIIRLSPTQWNQMKEDWWFLNPIPMVEWAVDKLIKAPLEMAKGGRQRLDNEWSRQARLQPDPCGWLQNQYDHASDSATRMKIKIAQKVLGCRQSSIKKDRCE
jgi:uncharacterized protein RhaS with RHS repeats